MGFNSGFKELKYLEVQAEITYGLVIRCYTILTDWDKAYVARKVAHVVYSI